MPERASEILIVGGGIGGVAAALAACRAGRTVVLSEETDWLGGQFTSQAVPPDEHPWIEQFGCTAGYRALRNGIRDYYRNWYPLRPAARQWPALNPGAGRVSGLCHEPQVALAVLTGLLAPHRAAGRLTVLTRHRPIAATVDHDRVEAVTLLDLETGHERWVTAQYVLDATETGQVLALAGLEWVVGAESRAEHDEPHARPVADPSDQQGITVCFALSHHEGADHVGERPAGYEFWRSYQPDFWPGPLLGWLAPEPRTGEARARRLEPNPDLDPLDVAAFARADAGDKELWTFRRILARTLFSGLDSDLSLVNWPLNDYWLRPLIGPGVEPDPAAVAGARELSSCLLYWLQTEAPRPDGGSGWPGLRIRPDVTGTADGLAKAVYVRESRRIRAVTTITEHHVSAELRAGRGPYRHADSVGIGAYRIDLHPSAAGQGYLDLDSMPFELPLGALLPQRVTNLVAAAKNIGTTHISNGCYRLHPVEWNVGEVAGALAAHCVAGGRRPHQVQADPARFAEFAAELDAAGVQRHWPELNPL